MEGSFSVCLKHVFAMEGGFSNDPSDHGGATNWGITAVTLAHWRGHSVTAADVRAIPPEEARAIYHANYWNAARCTDLPGGARPSFPSCGPRHRCTANPDRTPTRHQPPR